MTVKSLLAALRRPAMLLSWCIVGLIMAWCALALWFDGPHNPWLSGTLIILFLAGCAALPLKLRPISRALIAVFGLNLVVIGWWNFQRPRNDRDWAPEVNRLARATIEGDRLTLQNVRNFDYRAENDFTEVWEERVYHLDQLLGADMFLCYWGPTLIAHTIASWEFAGGPPLAISIETRKEKGETYSALRGFYRQYELYYVVADERDVIRLRTNFRGEQVYLYRINLRPEAARAILLDYLDEVNRLADAPVWYNAITQNCTTTIRHHALHVGAGKPWDWRILANGRIDQLGYERGTIDASLPFDELKTRSRITDKARAAASAADFSARIRLGLPGNRDAATRLGGAE